MGEVVEMEGVKVRRQQEHAPELGVAPRRVLPFGAAAGDALLQHLDGALDLSLPVLLGRVDLREPLQPHVDLRQLGRLPTVLEEGAGAEGVRVRRAEPAVRHLVLGGEGGVVVRRERGAAPVARRRFGRNLLLADELSVRLAVG